MSCILVYLRVWMENDLCVMLVNLESIQDQHILVLLFEVVNPLC
jgi:hypothetical protein